MNQNNPKFLVQQALDYINKNQLENAYSTLIQADQLAPNNIDIYHLLSILFGMMENYEQSEIYCKKALEINNNIAVIHNNLGSAQKLQGKYDIAEDSFRTAIKIQKNHIDAYFNLANLYLETERINDAEIIINSAKQVDSNNLGLKLAIANLYLKKENNNEAIIAYNDVLEAQPQNTDAIVNLAQIYEHTGENEKALCYYRKVLELIPGYEHSLAGIASILEKQGKYEEALSIIEPTLEHSLNIKVHTIGGRLHSRLKDYKTAETILTNARDMVATDQNRQELLFELGDVLDKQARYDEAFAVYSKANQINHLLFDRNDSQTYFDNIKSIYCFDKQKNLANSGNHTEQPIFIIGMPRSGTSLVEQILSSHSQIYGAGELEDIDNILYELDKENTGTAYPLWVDELNSEQLTKKADAYLDRINQLSGNTRYISNKMPHNFLHLGFIHQLFPKAKVIHCKRELKDTAISIYFHQFNSNHPYASDLDDLLFYYQEYEKLMKHWEQTTSLNMVTVDYEEIISEPELQSKRLIDFIGLEWEENCLNFYKSTRQVNTPSYHQVRQPIYKSSVNRYQNYKNHHKIFK